MGAEGWCWLLGNEHQLFLSSYSFFVWTYSCLLIWWKVNLSMGVGQGGGNIIAPLVHWRPQSRSGMDQEFLGHTMPYLISMLSRCWRCCCLHLFAHLNQCSVKNIQVSSQIMTIDNQHSRKNNNWSMPSAGWKASEHKHSETRLCLPTEESGKHPGSRAAVRSRMLSVWDLMPLLIP